MAAPGRVRLYLQSESEVQAAHDALHENAIQAGADLVALRVANDSLDMPGDVRRRRGARQPAPAGN